MDLKPDIFDITFELLSTHVGAFSNDHQGSIGT